MSDQGTSRVFPAQLRYWRHRRGLSQLDLSLAASVSARHISFLETGRASPSRHMVQRLVSALALPIREQNRMLQSAGHSPRFEDPDADDIAPEVRVVLERLIAQVAPWPAMVLDRCYTLVTANPPALALITQMIAEPEAVEHPLNLAHALFDPRLARPFIVNWEGLAARVLARLHQTALLNGADDDLRVLIDQLLAYPGVPADWRHPDFSQSTEPLIPFDMVLPTGVKLSFLLTMTMFSDPSRQLVQELQMETYIPADQATEAYVKAGCRLLPEQEAAG